MLRIAPTSLHSSIDPEGNDYGKKSSQNPISFSEMGSHSHIFPSTKGRRRKSLSAGLTSFRNWWANLHTLRALKTETYLEILIPEDNLDFGLDRYARIDSCGFVHPPQKVGLEVEIDWEFIRAYTVCNHGP